MLQGKNLILEIEQEQTIQYNILKYVNELCVKEGIPYFLFAGTLLGAVREHGFISWDDDVDICMKEEDIPRFIEAFQKDSNNRITLQTYDTDRHFFVPGVIRLCLDGTDKWGESYKRARFNKGIYFDIFILSYASNKGNHDNLCKKAAQKVTSVGYTVNRDFGCLSNRGKIKKIIYSLIPISFYKNRYRKMLSNREIDQDMRIAYISDYIGLDRLTYSNSCFNSSVMLDFAQGKFPCPVGYDEVLRTLYGKDYMTPKATKASYHKAELIDCNEVANNRFFENCFDGRDSHLR